MAGLMPWDSAIDLIKVGIDKIWPDKTEADRARAALAQAELNGQLKDIQNQWDNAAQQIEVNKEEAKNGSVFVSGARPFIMWICGFSLAYASIIEPIMRFAATMYGYHGEFPVIDTTITGQVLFGILGLGTMRSFEKSKGVASK